MDKERKFFMKKNIGVLYGGWSSERDISLGSGKCVMQSLKKQGFKIKGIDVDKKFMSKLKGIDVAFIALHGKPGEDGLIQGILDFLDIPYTGSGVLGSAIGMDKVVSKYLFEINDIPTPDFYFKDNINIDEIIIKLDLPVVVKPRAEGSSVGIHILDTKNEIKKAITSMRRKFRGLLFEKYISGMMATCGILHETPLPVLEIAPKKRKFYDYRSKYTEGMTEYIVPARIPKEQYKKIQEYALSAHRAINAQGFSRVDFVLDEDHNPYVLEVNTIPGLLSGSNLPLEASANGLSYDGLIFEILKTSRPKFKR
ncbi:MAG: D-alanine--D-alanine ligase [bacterium]